MDALDLEKYIFKISYTTVRKSCGR